MSSNLPAPELRDGERIRRGAYPEFTLPAIFVGWFLGALIALSIGYASLKLGFSIEGSELAAILGWGILRGLMRRTSIVENNINQTIASAVNGASSGIMFCVPALFILSYSDGLESVADGLKGSFFSPTVMLMIFACITGAFVGLAFVIPLRKQMIDFDRLPYPGGIAVATILKSPGAGIQKALLLLGGAAVSAAAYFALFLLHGEDHDWMVGEKLNLPFFLNITFFMSLMTIGVGFLSGKGGFWFGAGGFICYWVLAPLLSLVGSDSTQDLLDPPVRQAIVSEADANLLEQGLALVANNEPEAANQLRASLQLGIENKVPQPDDADADSELRNFGQLLSDADIAVAVVALTEKLKQVALVLDPDPENEDGEKLTVTVTVPKMGPPIDKDDDGNVEKTFTGKKVLLLVKKIEKNIGAQKMVDGSAALLSLQKSNPGLAAAIAEKTHSAELRKTILESGIDLEADNDEAKNLKAVASAGGAIGLHGSVPSSLNKKLFRPTGIGMLIGAAIGGIIMAFPLILSAFGALRQASKNRGAAADTGRDEIPIIALVIAVLLGLVVLVFLAFSSVQDMTLGLAITMAVLGTLWVWVAGVIVAECIGRTNWSPLSGMTLIAVTILILIARNGLNDPQTVISCIIVGAAICLAISQASDIMLDLKSGYLIGAVPRRQQIAQFVGAWLGPFVVIGLLMILAQSYEFGSDKLPAAQGKALASMIEGLMGNDIPAYRYGAGALLGLGLAVSGLGGIGVMVALGFYMPFPIVLTYSIGCLLRLIVDKVKGKHFSENVGIPIAAGLIVGEALVGVGIAVFRIFAPG